MPAFSAMELTIGIIQAVEPVSFRNAEIPPATVPVPASRPFSFLPKTPIIFVPRKSASPVLKNAEPMIQKQIIKMDVELVKSAKAVSALMIPKSARTVGTNAPVIIMGIGLKTKSKIVITNTTQAIVACTDIA